MTQGEKIKKVMKDLGIKHQKCLVCKELSKSAVSAAIQGTRSLSFHKLNILTIKFVEYMIENNIILDYDIKTFLEEDESLLANKEIENMKRDLEGIKDKETFVSKITRAEEIFSIYEVQIEDKIFIYDAAIKYFKSINDIELLDKYMWENYELFLNKKDKIKAIELLKEIIKNYCSIGRHESAVSISRGIDINYIKINMGTDTLVSICYNIALANCILKDYNLCLKWLSKLNGVKLNLKSALYTGTLKANALMEMKKYKEAERIYFEIIEKSNSEFDYLKANSYSNLADIYRINDDIKKSKGYIKMALSFDIKLDQYLMNIYLNTFLISVAANDDKIVIKEWFNKSLLRANKVNNINVKYRLFDVILKYYCSKEYIEDVLELVAVLEANSPMKKMEFEIFMRAQLFLNNYNIDISNSCSQILKLNELI